MPKRRAKKIVRGVLQIVFGAGLLALFVYAIVTFGWSLYDGWIAGGLERRFVKGLLLSMGIVFTTLTFWALWIWSNTAEEEKR